MSNFDYNLHVFRSPRFKSIVDEAIQFFNKTPIHSLPPPERFNGSGVYALYYVGEHELYRAIAEKNKESCNYPIYVGKAVPPGARKGIVSTMDARTLLGRLGDHKKSIMQAVNLNEADFRCRFMVLTNIESDLILPVESALIKMYRPLWNLVVDGFGNHTPGRRRFTQSVSEWDVLHPGRSWVTNLIGPVPDVGSIRRKVQQYLSNDHFLNSTTAS